MDPKKKFYLFKQSENFCAVPWNHIKVEMDGTIKTCVRGREVIGNITSDSVDNLLQSPILKEIKESLYNDNKHNNCDYCVRHEDETEHKFLRDLYNPMFKMTNVDYSDPTAFQLSAIDLHWSSTCNLKCITCWSKQSSAIALEEGKPILHTPSADADKIINLIIQSQYNLKEIYLSGGEPTLIKHNLNLLQRLDKDINCTIRVNTNMMFDSDNLIVEELKKFKNVLITISADSLGERFNFIRRGADWNVFLKNLNDLQKTNFKFRLNSVFFIASALYITETQTFFKDNYGIEDFTINQVAMDHSVIKCRNLSDNVKAQCREKILAHRDLFANNTNVVNELDACLQELSCNKEYDYIQFFEKYSTQWREIFTEL